MTFKLGDRVQYRMELQKGDPELYPAGVKTVVRVDGWKVFFQNEEGFDRDADLEPAPEPAEWTPGEGWRRTFRQEAIHRGDYLHLNFANEGASAVYWVREEQVPPLPTEPYTVIRVTWKDGTEAPTVLTLDGATWRGSGWAHGPASLARDITGFEVLAVPMDHSWLQKICDEERERVRRETAKAVLDRVRSLHLDEGGIANLHVIEREFGVEP